IAIALDDGAQAFCHAAIGAYRSWSLSHRRLGRAVGGDIATLRQIGGGNLNLLSSSLRSTKRRYWHNSEVGTAQPISALRRKADVTWHATALPFASECATMCLPSHTCRMGLRSFRDKLAPVAHGSRGFFIHSRDTPGGSFRDPVAKPFTFGQMHC